MVRKAMTPVAGAPPAPLTEAEGSDLERLEGIVEGGMASFMAVGKALAEISQRRLYRATHATFEDYCRERWNMGTNYARKQIRAAKVVATLGKGAEAVPGVPILPETEKAARPLTRVAKPLDRRKAWHRAVKDAQKAGRKPTSQDVERAVETTTGVVLGANGKIDKLASQRASREAQATAAEARHETKRVGYMRAALSNLQAAAKADDDRWAVKIGAQADRVETLLGHVLTVDRRS